MLLQRSRCRCSLTSCLDFCLLLKRKLLMRKKYSWSSGGLMDAGAQILCGVHPPRCSASIQQVFCVCLPSSSSLPLSEPGGRWTAPLSCLWFMFVGTTNWLLPKTWVVHLEVLNTFDLPGGFSPNEYAISKCFLLNVSGIEFWSRNFPEDT